MPVDDHNRKGLDRLARLQKRGVPPYSKYAGVFRWYLFRNGDWFSKACSSSCLGARNNKSHPIIQSQKKKVSKAECICPCMNPWYKLDPKPRFKAIFVGPKQFASGVLRVHETVGIFWGLQSPFLKAGSFEGKGSCLFHHFG